MGCFPKKSCWGDPSNPAAIAPNPNPSRFTLLDKWEFDNAYVLRVKYHDCTNYEGVKIMVYQGKFDRLPGTLDPHFCEYGMGPIARFEPSEEGLFHALKFAEEYGHQR